jgi:16S rRNA G1207 methylase RsmC
MTRNKSESRLSRLEAAVSTGRDIIVWCDDEDEVETKIADMIGRGEITANDRVRCVHWLRAQSQSGEHERSLEELN